MDELTKFSATVAQITNGNSAGLFNHVLIYIGDLHLVLSALKLDYPGCWNFDNGATSKNDDVLNENVGLLCVLPLAVHLTFFY